MSTNRPFTFDRPDTCPYCETKRSLELYNHRKTPMNYSIMLDQKVNLKDRVFDLAYMKCKKCGKEYFPRWQDNKILPALDMNVEDFMALYKSMNKKAEST